METENIQSFLENQLLIAMPQLKDPYFSNTVTYLWKHSDEGALGVIINKPLKASLSDIFGELGITCSIDEAPFKQRKVLAGGPVEKEKGFIIHDSIKSWSSSVKVANGLSISTSRELLQDIADGKGPEHYLVVLGCAGWDAGQLESEITANAWLTAPATSELVFSQDYANKADSAAAQLGVDLSQLSPEAGHS
jgi:putative transcriptional regulator